MRKTQGTSTGDKPNGRLYGQDLMRGEHPSLRPGRTRQRPTSKVVAGASQPTDRGRGQASRAGREGEAEGLGEVVHERELELSTPQKFASPGPKSDLQQPSGGTSIFDPVLTELVYRWFCPAAGRVLDPFAGGSVRGIVASRLGLFYAGIDLRDDQIRANQQQAMTICREGDPAPIWLTADSRSFLDGVAEGSADLIFTCPPYGDLERYSDDPKDISNMAEADFDQALREIILKATRSLKRDRFSVWVASDYRRADGGYAMFPSKIRDYHWQAGMRLYNEAILLNAMGSLPIRAGKQFEATRKLGRCHQEILIFLKGEEKAATSAMARIDARAIDDAIFAKADAA
jgi:hypothetical protein